MVHTIKNRKELNDILKVIRRDSFFTGYPTSSELKSVITFGKEGSGQNKEAWLTYGVTLNYQGEYIRAMPVTLANLAIFKVRPIVEKIYNGTAVVSEPQDDRIKRESTTYRSLYIQGFNTLDSRQELVDINWMLLTTGFKHTLHITSAIDQSSKHEKLEHIANSARLLKDLHEKGNIAWCDASLVNFFYDDNMQLRMYNFGLKPNPEKDPEELKAKDILTLCISGTYRTNLIPTEIAHVVLMTYNASRSMQNKLAGIITNDLEQKPHPGKQILYNNSVHALTENQIGIIKRQVYHIIDLRRSLS